MITLVIPASNKRMGIKRALTLKRVIVCDSADAVTRPDWKAVAANLYIGCNDAGTTIFGKLCDVRVEPLKKAG